MFRINLASRRELKQQWPTAKATKLASLKKLISGCFQIYRTYFISLNAGKFFGSWRKGGSGKEKESSCFVFTSSTKREVRHFHFVVQRRGKQRKITATLSSPYFASLLVLLPFFSFFFRQILLSIKEYNTVIWSLVVSVFKCLSPKL